MPSRISLVASANAREFVSTDVRIASISLSDLIIRYFSTRSIVGRSVAPSFSFSCNWAYAPYVRRERSIAIRFNFFFAIHLDAASYNEPRSIAHGAVRFLGCLDRVSRVGEQHRLRSR